MAEQYLTQFGMLAKAGNTPDHPVEPRRRRLGDRHRHERDPVPPRCPPGRTGALRRRRARAEPRPSRRPSARSSRGCARRGRCSAGCARCPTTGRSAARRCARSAASCAAARRTAWRRRSRRPASSSSTATRRCCLSFESQDGLDHVLFLFRERGRWGAVARSRDPGLHGRKPVFRSPRQLAASYQDAYVDLSGRVTGYAVADLRELGRYDWRLAERNVRKVEKLARRLSPPRRCRCRSARYQRRARALQALPGALSGPGRAARLLRRTRGVAVRGRGGPRGPSLVGGSRTRAAAAGKDAVSDGRRSGLSENRRGGRGRKGPDEEAAPESWLLLDDDALLHQIETHGPGRERGRAPARGGRERPPLLHPPGGRQARRRTATACSTSRTTGTSGRSWSAT